MLRVSDFLSLPHFETFRLIAGSDGLDNVVGGSSILEWESPKEIAVDFAPNDFVLTTLYMYRDELDRADEALKALIRRRVSAIAIKTTFTDTCSQEILELAELYKIPIFIYRDAFLEDLIFAIESAVFNDSSNDMALDYLKYLLNSDSGDIIAMARKLFQHSNTIRHRLDRIKSLMGISSSSELTIQLSIFSRMHSIRNLFGNEPLI
ncbi:MAG: PucR family transcriptional regulator [Anaerovoracaceae bacterium]|nr:PucR family transcriptional regulator [Anaerovoracaceae bacterium]